MSEPLWVSKFTLIVLQNETIVRDGGLAGIRDQGLLDSALARPKNACNYGVTEITALAASYAFGIARNHPFNDGNKRAAFLASALFLRKNGFRLSATQLDAIEMFSSLAAGEVSEDALANWFAQHVSVQNS